MNGDFNIHMDDAKDRGTKIMSDILLSAGADIETAGPKIEIANPV